MTATKHAYDRAKTRLSWKQSTLDRMLPRIFFNGIGERQAKGQLKVYFSKMSDRSRQCNNIKIYGNNTFLFNDYKLITILPLPPSLNKYI